MKISSSYKDYYDSTLGLGVDDFPHYIREEFVKDISNLRLKVEWIKNHGNITKEEELLLSLKKIGDKLPNCPSWIQIGILGFCGKVYPFYYIENPDKTLKTAFSISKYEDLIRDAQYSLKPIREAALNFVKNNIDGVIKIRNWATSEMKVASFSNLGKGFEIDEEIFRFYASPSILKTGNALTINPRLYGINFQSCMDPYTTFQEISMFLGNVLVDNSNMEPRPISDKLRAETKGFDIWSFRRHKTEDRKFKKKEKKNNERKK